MLNEFSMRSALAGVTAVALLASLGGCYQASQQAKTADQIAAEKAAEKARKVETTKGHFTQAIAGAATIQGLVAAKDWEAASDALLTLQRHLEKVLASRDVSNEVKGHVAGLFPTINHLRTQIKTESDKAPATAEMLTRQFQRTTDTLVAMGWLSSGGGAGTDVDTTPGADEIIDEQ